MTKTHVVRARTTQEVPDRKEKLIEWSSGIFGVVWGVWWTWVAVEVIGTDKTLHLPFTSQPITSGILVVTLVGYAPIFIFQYTKWMLRASEASWDAPLRDLIRSSQPMVVSTVIFTTLMVLTSLIVDLPARLYLYGFAVTLAWILTVIAIVVDESRA